jgi:hypothetical protein
VDQITEGLVYFVVFLFSTTLHEAAHAWAALRGGEAAGVFAAPDRASFGHVADAAESGIWAGTAGMLGAFFSVNLLLAVLNLLPLPPLDGSAAVPLALSPEGGRRYQRFLWSSPMLGMIGMFTAWRLCDVVFEPIFFGAVSALYPGASYR